MKKSLDIATRIILSVIILSIGIVAWKSKQDVSDDDSYHACYDEGYDIGFDEGYEYGRVDGAFFDRDDNMAEIACDLEDEAIHYVVEQGYWHPEEACTIIEAYQNNKAYYKNGSSPSKQDYLKAVDSLICFYNYFYCKLYK